MAHGMAPHDSRVVFSLPPHNLPRHTSHVICHVVSLPHGYASRPFAVRATFDDLTLLKSTCCAWAMKNVFEFDTPRSSPTRYEIVCRTEGCPWRLYASSIGGSKAFRVNAFNGDHTCTGLTHAGHKNATVRFICDWNLRKVRQQPHYCSSHLVKDMKTQ